MLWPRAAAPRKLSPVTDPITPPQELIERWLAAPEYSTGGRCTLITLTSNRLNAIVTKAAQWGADQKLEARRYLAQSDLTPPTSAKTTTMTESTNAFICVGEKLHKFRPQPDATPDELLEIFVLLNLAVTPERYKMLSESVQRHFTTQPE